MDSQSRWTPKINGHGGRDHWPHVQSIILAGGDDGFDLVEWGLDQQSVADEGAD